MITGCGYTHQPLFPQGIQTVAVPIFKSDVFYQGIERHVTEALIKQIELQTIYKIAPLNQADSVIRGTVTHADQGRLSRRREGGLPTELELKLTVQFQWLDLQTGEVLRSRNGLTSVGRYIPATEVGEQYQVAQYQAAQKIASSIIAAMGANW